ncbi:hypothetical protein BV22DRAFT_1132919 [Leucogyrophana mollusca]|uniref:Uncharacterized protein n=1 Tax=Leucogyrophana mollusca TaxID=85980 RepID=A0ACB8B4S6_9AGAM|nr:hypothetical protein BV22DRAFT_1132919 [Leucogyrophana mollusca]
MGSSYHKILPFVLCLRALLSTCVPLFSFPADFPLELVRNHPECNSTLILRSKIISTALPHAQPQHLPGLHPHSNVHRKLLPRPHDGRGGMRRFASIRRYRTTIPPYPILHSAVYTPSSLSPTTLSIEAILLPNISTDPTSGLYRTALALLNTLPMYIIWLARLSDWLGWRVEDETLRIARTRSWASVILPSPVLLVLPSRFPSSFASRSSYVGCVEKFLTPGLEYIACTHPLIRLLFHIS